MNALSSCHDATVQFRVALILSRIWRRSALFSILCSVLSIFKPSTSFAALSHNICFVMPRINHHQKQPAWLLRACPHSPPFILDSFINAIERHLQRSQPQVGSKWAHAATDMKAKEGEEWGAPLLNRQSNQTRCHTTQVAIPFAPKPSVLRSPPKLTAKCEVNIAPSWRVPPAACCLLLAATLKGNLR